MKAAKKGIVSPEALVRSGPQIKFTLWTDPNAICPQRGRLFMKEDIMRKLTTVLVTAMAAALLPAMAVNAEELISIGFAQVGHESDWRTASTKSCQDVFSEENGYNLSFVDCDNDEAAQKEAVRSFIEQEVDYIILAPIQAAGWDVPLQEAADAGIPVIVADRQVDADASMYDAFIGTDCHVEGVTAGKWLEEYLGGEAAKILVIGVDGKPVGAGVAFSNPATLRRSRVYFF